MNRSLRPSALFAEKALGRPPVHDENHKPVGMITKDDITRGILVALQKDYKDEVRPYRANHLFEDMNSDRTTLVLRYTIKARDFNHGGISSSHINRHLIRMEIREPICTGCTVCARNCPAETIHGERRQIHHIDDLTCIRCGICVQVCNFNAIAVES